MYVEPRPLARSFLKAVSEIFTVYIYTAGEKQYADTVLNIIDPENLIQKRFYRDSCKKQGGVIIKDLKYLKKVLRTKQEMVLVDDNSLSIEKNYPFAIQVKSFEGEQDDRELLAIFEKVLKFYI
jgi:TFIIF-interacting CTD phosphatase-like protein